MPEAKTIQLDIVSAESALFSGQVLRVLVSGSLGELGIEPGHTALLSPLKPGQVTFTQQEGSVEHFYVSGGVVEVQPDHVTILADTCIRGEALDAEKATAAQAAAQAKLADQQAEADYAQALRELAQATAQLRMIQELNRRRKV
ncbi:MAG: F0F1 ATP synthase subunit epsilon [Legionellales bacterium]|nr:F0F1 ATP synthase subunit epsilon [Legionellales bacterium]|tara:strand:+ start:125 stop:556 length:432 start_codon:yes stop_codon:yes gene_type:complete